MVTWILDGKEISANAARIEILRTFPGIQQIRKMTLFECVEMRAANGDEKAKALVARLQRIEK